MLISKLRLKETYEDDIKSLYRELCDFSHPSHRLLIESREDPKVVFFYNRKWYEDSHSLHTRSVDVIFGLTLSQFPKAPMIFLKKPLVKSSLISMSMRLTLVHNLKD